MNKQFQDEICYLDGKLLPLKEASVDAANSGLLYGDGIFETLRIYNGRVFKLSGHLARLQEGANYLELTLPPLEEVRGAVSQVITANAAENGSMRLTLTGGENRVKLWPRADGSKPTLLITLKKGISYSKELYTKGGTAVTVSFPRNQASPLVKIKSLNYLENMLGKKEAVTKSCNEGLFLNTQGELTEGTTSNLFVYDGATLLTPPTCCGILPGITRDVVIEIARDNLNLPVQERVLYREDLIQAQEAFLTASVLEIMPLVKVDQDIIGSGVPGEITGKLLTEYRQQTG